MRRRTLVALLAALSATVARAGDWDAGGPSGGYDVSVDLNVQGGVTFESFDASLQPYGDWLVVGSYGRVWRPRVAAGWRPYYHGRWEWTNEGWFWVSDEPWGWAAYHYGRWAYDPYYGWIWVPGYEWAPAWVSWRVSGDVIGWAPLAPGFSVYVSSYPFVDFWWTFVPSVRFVSVPVYTVAYAPAHARRWFHATAPAPARPAPRRGYASAPSPAWGGPAPRAIEQRLGRPLAPARVVAAPSPGHRARPGEIAVYRPERQGALPSRAPHRAMAPDGQGNGRGPGPAPAPGGVGSRGAAGERGAQTFQPERRGSAEPSRPERRGSAESFRPERRGGGQAGVSGGGGGSRAVERGNGGGGRGGGGGHAGGRGSTRPDGGGRR
jgi:hypothetical protein